MKTKIISQLKALTKDLGLSQKAIEDLSATILNGISEGATEEEITAQVNSMLPFAKMIQGEVTRKLQAQRKPQPEVGGDEGSAGGGEMPEWFKAYADATSKQIEGLTTQLTEYRVAEAKAKRTEAIKAKAQELKIPNVFMKRFAVGDDEDVTEVLTAYKQELIADGLMSADVAPLASNLEAQLAEEAKTWAEGLE